MNAMEILGNMVVDADMERLMEEDGDSRRKVDGVALKQVRIRGKRVDFPGKLRAALAHLFDYNPITQCMNELSCVTKLR